MRGGIPGIRTEVCTYNDKCLADPSDRFGLDICDDHALKVHEIVELMLARERIHDICMGRTPVGEYVPPSASEMKEKCDAWVGRFANGRARGHMTGPEGYVYYVRFGEMVKIGFSRDPRNRLRDIPHEEVLKIDMGAMADERAAHVRCAEWRVVGEWFRDCPEFRAAAGLT